jgi:membrane associated rhomboid family serine protease
VLPLRDNVPTRHFPVVTVGIIAVNVVVWLWEVTGTSVNQDVLHYGYYPCSVEGPCVSPAPSDHLRAAEGVFTSMFMHGSWLHIGGNMLFLWIFGNNVEDALGRVRYLVWYLLAGIAATAAQTFVTLQFGNAADASIPNVGASGAIAGVLGAYLLILPRASVLTLFFLGFFIFLREIPALFYLGLWFLFQALEGGISLVEPQSGGGVAFFAHLGGFVFGIVTVRLVMKRQPLRPAY